MSDSIPSETPKPVAPKSLVAKLASVMAEISRVKKAGFNKFQNYAYATEADLVDEVREKLGHAGVFILTSVEEVVTTDTGRKTSGSIPIKLTRAKVKHTFCDADSAETREVISYGEGEDQGDKGVYKAVTGAVKYFISKNFLMSTGDDPESDESDKPAEKPKAAARASQTAPAPDAAPHVPGNPAQAEPAGDEAARLKYLRGKFNQALQAVKTGEEFKKVRGEFERAHGKEFIHTLTGHRPGETFMILMTEHWNRIEPILRNAKWRADVGAAQSVGAFRKLEKHFLDGDVEQSKENEDALNAKGKALGLSEYGIEAGSAATVEQGEPDELAEDFNRQMEGA